MTTAIAIPLSEPTLEEYVSLLKTGVQSYFIQYWYEETNAILNLQPQYIKKSPNIKYSRTLQFFSSFSSSPYFRSKKPRTLLARTFDVLLRE